MASGLGPLDSSAGEPVPLANGVRMASSGASTPAGRRRSGAKSAAKPARKRPGSAHSRSGAPPARKPQPKPRAKPKAKSKPKPTQARQAAGRKVKAPPKAKPSRRPARQPSRPLSTRGSRTLTVALCLLVLAAGLGAAYFLWFRDSALVAVEEITVEGMEGPETQAVTDALTREGSEMTTLNVDEGALASAVSGYSTVLSVNSDADFPHGLTLHVTSLPPVMNATDGDGPPVPVAADGTLLPDVEADEGSLPTVTVPELPPLGKLEGEGLELAAVAGAAPDPLRPLIKKVSPDGPEGLEITLDGEVRAVFGDGSAAPEKWAALAAVLADSEVKTLTHIDVRVPERPAIGGAAPAQRGG